MPSTSASTRLTETRGRQKDVYGKHWGRARELPGVRLMASGLPHAQWNNGT